LTGSGYALRYPLKDLCRRTPLIVPPGIRRTGYLKQKETGDIKLNLDGPNEGKGGNVFADVVAVSAGGIQLLNAQEKKGKGT